MTDARTPPAYYYDDPAVVDEYDTHEGLLPGEDELFQQHVGDATRVLDLGVGAGRTTPFLAPRAASYIGMDYSAEMVARARRKYPDVDLQVGDAADLSRFPDASFDTVVFSFNGLGVIASDDARGRCLREVARVLTPGGAFVFSLHNARYLLFVPSFAGVGAIKAVWRTIYAAVVTARQARSRLPSGAFWRGSGYVRDPQQVGLPFIYVCRPDQVRREADLAGLSLERVVGIRAGSWRDEIVPNYIYYVCRRPR